MEVDRKKLNISVEHLKPAYFTVQQKEHLVNKSITVQLFLSKNSFNSKDLP